MYKFGGDVLIIDENSKAIIQLLINNGYDAYAVGGCVRDSIMGRISGDFDITTSAKPEETESVLKSAGIKYFETGIKHGTITAVVGGVNYEITTFRTDGEYCDNRHPENVRYVSDIKDDLARRDFTINAIAYNEKKGYVDLYGGIDDINAHLIRAVGNPVKRFNEDALRIMRGIRFASVLGFDIEAKTEQAMLECKELLQNISSQRIFVELIKLLQGDFCEKVLLKYKSIIGVIIPELTDCFDFPQNTKWHLYDVYSHSVKSIALAPNVDYIRFALLLHDSGKPQCKTTDSRGQDHFKGHPAVSTAIAENVMSRFKVSNDFFKKVSTLIEYHDYYIRENPVNIKKWLNRLGEEMTLDYIDVKIADLSSHNLILSVEEILTLERIKIMTENIIKRGEPYKISQLAVNGSDLINLGYRGKEIGEKLESLLNFVMENPDCNKKDILVNFCQSEKEKP